MSLRSLFAGLAPMYVIVQSSIAQPTQFVELGELDSPVLLTIDVNLDAGNGIAWFHVVLPQATVEAGFIDIYTWPPFIGNFMRGPTIGVFAADGSVVDGSRSVGDSFQAQLSYGMQDPRPAPPLPELNDPDNPYPPFAGQDGPFAGGEYWLALGNYAFFGPNNFQAYSTVAPTYPERYTRLFIGILPPGFPYCDNDLNWDGSADQEDIAYLINVLAGGENPTGRFPDINRDGNEDMDDLSELIDRIAGGGCP